MSHKGMVSKTNAKTYHRSAASPARGLLKLIGNTPLIPLTTVQREVPGVRLFAKLEWFNPGGSVKDRAAASIIADAEASGKLTPQVRLLDASSGNTAIAYAMIAAVKGYRTTLCVPKNVNAQVLGLLRTYGAEIILTDPLEGSDGAIRQARRLAAERPNEFLYLDQYNNPANWKAHYRTTAQEIWRQTEGTVTHFVAGLGTTGTFTGTTRRLKELNPLLYAVAVEPEAALHGLEGLKHLETALVPGIYDATLVDETIFLSTETAEKAVQRLAQQEGLLVGPSSGAAFAASLSLAKRLVSREMSETIVMVFPDSGARHAAEGVFTPSDRRTLTS